MSDIVWTKAAGMAVGPNVMTGALYSAVSIRFSLTVCKTPYDLIGRRVNLHIADATNMWWTFELPLTPK